MMIKILLILALLGISFHDIKTHVIKDGVSLFGILIALHYQLFYGDIKVGIIGMTAGILSVFVMNTLKIQTLGGGDAKLMGMIGAFTNWQIAVLTTLGALALSKIIKAKAEIRPYAPFITASFIMVIICQTVTSLLKM